MTFILEKESRALPAQCGNDPLPAIRLPGSSGEIITKTAPDFIQGLHPLQAAGARMHLEERSAAWMRTHHHSLTEGQTEGHPHAGQVLYHGLSNPTVCFHFNTRSLYWSGWP